ncbi:fimbrial protein StaE [Enterobacter bugandensis]|uniref:fimbrial protein StaE n=1 Tax=Enterobacter bugandensis TaxID=881260 RepID=UPI0025C8AC93|nr:fimbrial protein StaE [Enterobacter bugandensis]
MKFNSLFLALVMAGGLFSGASQAITGTDQLQGIITATVEAGTCNAQITDSSSASVSEINFGDVFKNEIGTRTEPFNIELTECYGVKNATLTAQPGTGNSCSGASYATTGTTNTAVEIWKGTADTGTKLECKTGSPSNAIVTTLGISTTAKSATIPMIARWVLANGKVAADIATGDATSLITFSVEYQ